MAGPGLKNVDPMIGREIAGYRIERLLGRGGMGVVYLAESLSLGRKVALKLLPLQLGGDGHFRDRFLRESRVAASLDHPNVIPIYEAGEVDGQLYIAMRFVEGTDLRAALRTGPLDPSEALDILAGIADALDVAHRHGLVHRDVKPANILVAETPRHGYLADFGLTKLASAGASSATLGDIVGTPDYLAPEQIRGEGVDGRADVYSLGCVLYECLVGEPPFGRTSDLATLWAQLQQDPVAPSLRRPDLPESIDAVLARALAKEPASRYGTCTELIAAAATALRVDLPRPAARRPRRGRAPSRFRDRRVMAIAAAAVVVAVVAGALLTLPRSATVVQPPGAVLGARSSPTGAEPSAAPGSGSPAASAPAAVAGTSPVPSGLAAVPVETVGFLDATTERLVATLPLADATDQSTFADGSFWVLASAGHILYQIDPVTHHSRAFTVPLNDLAQWTVADGSIWAADADAARVVRVDTATGHQFPPITLSSDPNARGDGVAVGAGSVWVSLYGAEAGASRNIGKQVDVKDEIIRLDPASGSVQARIPIDYPDTLAFGNDALWVTGLGALREIDPSTDKLTGKDTQLAPRIDFAIPNVAFGNGDEWAASDTLGTVWKVDRNGVVSHTYQTGYGAKSPAYSDAKGIVWVANSGAGTVTGIDAATGEVTTLTTSHSPTSVAVGAGQIMVTVQVSVGDEIAAVPGHVLRLASDSDPLDPSPDPAVNNGFHYRLLAFATCAKLLNYPDEPAPQGFVLQPEIAAAMPDVSADGLTYTFTVRPGFRFSPPSNEPITAETFRHSIERALSSALGPDLKGNGIGIDYLGDVVGAQAFYAGKADHVTGLSAAGDRLTIRLVAPAPNFLDRLAMSLFCPVPSTVQAVQGAFGANPPFPSSGPYYVSGHSKIVVLSRNPNYIGRRSASYDAIAIETYLDPAEAVKRVNAGTLDALLSTNDVLVRPIGDLATEWGPASENAKEGRQRLLLVAAPFVYYLILNRSTGPLTDPSIRRAIELAIDRTAAAAISNAPPLGRIFSPAIPGPWTDILPLDSSDLAEARTLMHGRQVKLTFDPRCGCDDLTKELTDELARVGMAATVASPGATSFDVSIWGTQTFYPDPWLVLDWIAQHSPDGWLTPGDLDAIDRVKTLAGADRIAAADAAQRRLVTDEAVIVPVAYPESGTYVGDGVGCRIMQPALFDLDIANLCPANAASTAASPGPSASP